MTGADLGVLGDLAEAIGLFEDGSPNSDWFGHPDTYLARMLSDDDQRNALVSFVDDVLGGEERTTAPGGTTWLPVVSLRPPADPLYLDVCVTIADESPAGQPAKPVRIGLGLEVRTTTPVVTRTTLEIPLFQVDGNGVTVAEPFLLGQVGGRIRVAATVVVDTEVIDEIGIDLDIPTNDADADPSFGLTLTGLQLPGAPEPRDIRISADGADELDDAVLDLVLSLVRSLVANPPGTPALGTPAPRRPGRAGHADRAGGPHRGRGHARTGPRRRDPGLPDRGDRGAGCAGADGLAVRPAHPGGAARAVDRLPRRPVRGRRRGQRGRLRDPRHHASRSVSAYASTPTRPATRR